MKRETAMSEAERRMSEADRLKDCVGRKVVLDTDSFHLYAGTLVSVDPWFYELADADVHDSTSTSTTRDLYIINVQKFGVKKNRDRVLVRRERVVSISRLDHVTDY
jgi:small nuclear ribonucleoprotein (snRNP)-like protein